MGKVCMGMRGAPYGGEKAGKQPMEKLARKKTAKEALPAKGGVHEVTPTKECQRCRTGVRILGPRGGNESQQKKGEPVTEEITKEKEKLPSKTD